MQKELKKYIDTQSLFAKTDRLLLAISGGIDSMTLAHLLWQGEYNFALAHCNFNLRGKESDGDQEFIEHFAEENQIEIFLANFNTQEYAQNQKLSIQMAARELRYNWFNNLLSEYNFDYLLTAHNLNDSVETMLINLSRGTGLKGLTGIQPKREKLVRPLLFATRTEIEAFQKENGFQFREDSSNAETKYLRNAIRHNVIPAFQELNPSFLENVQESSQLLNSTYSFYSKKIENLKKELLESTEHGIEIRKDSLSEIEPEILFEILASFSFSIDTCRKLISGAKSSQTGTFFESSTHRIVNNRSVYLINKLKINQRFDQYYIEESIEFLEEPLPIKISRFDNGASFDVRKNRMVATLDADKLIYPLVLRKWQHGDYFIPFGMKGRKKLSAFFKDEKLSLPQKENIWLLVNGNGEIIWIINFRSDNRYKITKETARIIEFELLMNTNG